MGKRDLKVTILDYGVGNLHSLAKAVGRFGTQVTIQKDLRRLNEADCLIFPGVGAFGPVMAKLFPYREKFAELTKTKPLLGICLGMQLLFEESVESGEHKGLGLIEGKVEKLPAGDNLKIPHMGWNRVHYQQDEIFKGIGQDEWFYFAHSYIAQVDAGDQLGFTYYGRKFASVINKGLIYGTQFHPEKSSQAGLKFLNNFLQIAKGQPK